MLASQCLHYCLSSKARQLPDAVAMPLEQNHCLPVRIINHLQFWYVFYGDLTIKGNAGVANWIFQQVADDSTGHTLRVALSSMVSHFFTLTNWIQLTLMACNSAMESPGFQIWHELGLPKFSSVRFLALFCQTPNWTFRIFPELNWVNWKFLKKIYSNLSIKF